MPTVIGLDLGKPVYRAAQITHKKGRTILDKILSYDNTVRVVENKQTDSLREFIKSAGFTTKDAVVALPEANVFSTIITLPLSNDKDIRSYLDLQGGKIFPKPPGELIYSFKVLGPNEQKPSETDVNVVASGKNYVEKLYEQLRDYGLNILSIEPEAYAVVRALINRPKRPFHTGVTLIINMGFEDVDMMVVKNGVVRFSRNITLGGLSFNKAVAQNLGVTEEQAEEYKKSYGMDGDFFEGRLKRALEPVVATMLTEITRTINYYITRNAASVFNKIIFTGGSAIMPGLLAYTVEKLGIEAELADPFSAVDDYGAEKVKGILTENSGAEYTISIGLALKEDV